MIELMSYLTLVIYRRKLLLPIAPDSDQDILCDSGVDINEFD